MVLSSSNSSLQETAVFSSRTRNVSCLGCLVARSASFSISTVMQPGYDEQNNDDDKKDGCNDNKPFKDQ